jgi:thioredoxin 2
MKVGLDERGVIVPCPSCGTANRLAYATLNKRTRCAKCKTMLPAPGEPVEAPSSAAFDAAAHASAIPLVVDFWAPWCGPCRTMAPELERVGRSHAGQWLVVKVNTDVLSDVAGRYRIMSLPTLAVIEQGRELARIAGMRPAAEIERFVSDTMAAQTRRAS